MKGPISTNYVQVSEEEARQQYEAGLRDAWTDASLAEKQWEVVRPELELARTGRPLLTYKAAVDCLRKVGAGERTILDVGAGCAHYADMIAIAKLPFAYTAFDFNPAFQNHATARIPGLRYDLGNATKLPYKDGAFDIVFHSAVIMHMMDWKVAIGEAVRVSREWVLLHRTPIVLAKPTRYYVKEAYGVPCVEIHFWEADLIAAVREAGLKIAHTQHLFMDGQYGHRSYLLRKA